MLVKNALKGSVSVLLYAIMGIFVGLALVGLVEERLEDSEAELRNYKSIGTVEECRKAMKKRKAERPKMCGMEENCPDCCTRLKAWYTFCPECGQAIEKEIMNR